MKPTTITLIIFILNQSYNLESKFQKYNQIIGNYSLEFTETFKSLYSFNRTRVVSCLSQCYSSSNCVLADLTKIKGKFKCNLYSNIPVKNKDTILIKEPNEFQLMLIKQGK